MSESLKPLKWYKELTGTRERREAGVFLVEGEKAISQIVGLYPASIREILSVAAVPQELEHYPVRVLTGAQCTSISHSVTPQGIMATVSLPGDCYEDTLPAEPGNRILLLEDIQDPGNIGTLLRTAAAFSYNGIILSEKCADPFSPKCVQAAAGAVLSLWIRRSNSFLSMTSALREQGWLLTATALDGTSEASSLTAEKLILALGNEASGISTRLRSLADKVFSLPMSQQKAESLNVAVCGGICMYLSTQ